MRLDDAGLYFGDKLPGGLGSMMFIGMVSSGFASVWFMFRGIRIHFSQDHMCRVLQNFRKCRICSVSEGLRSYLTTKKLRSESTKGM